MKHILLLALLVLLGSSSLYAAKHKKAGSSYRDHDFDGVSDRYDRCPHTPFFAIVNKKGCMIKRIRVSGDQERLVSKLLSRSH